MKPDVCCWACKSQYGCMNSNCEHHVAARISDDADDNARQTVRRPTEDQAIRNVMREQRGRRNEIRT